MLGYMRAAKELVERLCHTLYRGFSGPRCCGERRGRTPVCFLGLKMLGSNLRLIGATVDEDPSYWHPALTDYIKRSDKAMGFASRIRPFGNRVNPGCRPGLCY